MICQIRYTYTVPYGQSSGKLPVIMSSCHHVIIKRRYLYIQLLPCLHPLFLWGSVCLGLEPGPGLPAPASTSVKWQWIISFQHVHWLTNWLTNKHTTLGSTGLLRRQIWKWNNRKNDMANKVYHTVNCLWSFLGRPNRHYFENSLQKLTNRFTEGKTLMLELTCRTPKY